MKKNIVNREGKPARCAGTVLVAALALVLCVIMSSCSGNSLINGINLPTGKNIPGITNAGDTQIELEINGDDLMTTTESRIGEETVESSAADTFSDTSEAGSEGKSAEGEIIIKRIKESIVTPVKGGIGDNDLTIPDVVALVKDSVVEIRTEVLVNSFFSQQIETGAGSGVIVSADGYIITNHHVIEGAESVTVRLTNGKKYDATVIASDAQADIAIVKIDPGTDILCCAVLGDSDDIILAESVIAIGNPLGTLGGTVTNGIISALSREIRMENGVMTVLQTNAAINPGNSGGALFNMRGELIGIVNAKVMSEEVEGIGFAIPINTSFEIFTELLEKGYVGGRPDIGLSTVEQTYSVGFGSYRTYVFVTESKYTDELKYGDLLVSINGVSVSSQSDISYVLSFCKVGDSVEVVASRDNKKITVSITLAEYIPEAAK